MDLLFKEYASPLLLLNGMIEMQRLRRFIDFFKDKLKERGRWEFYIHKLSPFNPMTWEEFNKKLDESEQESRPVSKEQLETTVTQAFSILDNFQPE